MSPIVLSPTLDVCLHQPTRHHHRDITELLETWFSLGSPGSVNDVFVGAAPEADPKTGVQAQVVCLDDSGNTRRRVEKYHRKESQLLKGRLLMQP